MNFRNNVKFHRSWIADSLFFSNVDLPGEEWKEFNRYGDHVLTNKYTISNKGRIRDSKGMVIKGGLSFDGYHEMTLSEIPIRVHRAVLLVFQGPPPQDIKNPTVQHINHDKLDNRIENLCWMPAFDNNQEGHGVRCKIVDKDGEHIFPSQKFASRYIGRHDDYISEGIGYSYKMTTAQGESFEVYTEIDGEWVKYERRMPNNRRWCRLLKDGQVINFDSFQQCNEFLKLPLQTLGECVRQGWPIPIDKTIKFYIYDRSKEDYVEYIPKTKKQKPFSRQCVIIDVSGSHTFPSISKAALYIGRDQEWLRLAIRDNKPIKNHDGMLIQAYCLDPEGGRT